jgi:hypothetical protein
VEDAVMATQEEPRLCTLATAVGKSEACPEAACPFWEPGGAALHGRCAFEALGLPADAGLAEWLLEIRGRLEDASSAEQEHALRGAFHQLLSSCKE